MIDERLTYLLDRYLDGEITDVEAKELLTSFNSDPAAKSWFINEVTTSNLIYGLKSDDDFGSEVIDHIRIGSDESTENDLELVEIESRSDGGEQPIFKMRRRAVALGVAACAVLFLLGFVYKVSNPSPVAVLAHSDDVVWQGESKPQKGDLLYPGTFRLTSGVATFKFGDAVRVTLEGPAEYELIKSDVTRLNHGTLSAHVLPEGIGFEVRTERAKVVDLGTTFSIAVDEEQETAVTVFEGKVDVENTVDHKCEIIEEGLEVKLSRKRNGVEQGLLQKRPASFGLMQLFGVSKTSGNVRFMDAQKMGNLAEFRDSDNVLVIPEQVGKVIEGPQKVTVSEPGSYGRLELKERTEIIEVNGVRADIYLVQYNPEGNLSSTREGPAHFLGEVIFNRPILGVISRPNQLIATDDVLGHPRFNYDDGVTSRGIESGDQIELGPDRKSLKLDWKVSRKIPHRIDQIRVLVESD